MALCASGPVNFESGAGISVSRKGQLECDCSGIETWLRQMKGNFNVIGLAEGVISDGADAPHTGVSFDLTSYGRGFYQMEVSLIGKWDGSSVNEFCICVNVSDYLSTTVSMKEYGVEKCRVSCDGDEHLGIRLDGTGSRIEYLVNDKLVYTSKHVARLPLVCKLVNKIEKNLPRGYMSDKWIMPLPVKHLQWSKAAFKVVTLQALQQGAAGDVKGSCISLSGDELAKIEAPPGQSIGDLRLVLAQQIDIDPHFLRLLSTDGRLLADSELWPIAC